jgi:hypothetical protein
MTNNFDPKKRSEGPPHRGGPDLIRDRDGFMMQQLPEATALALALKQAYVLELIKAEADPDFSRSDEYLRIVIERVTQRFVADWQRDGVVIRSTPPSPKALRLWHRKYVEGDFNSLALLPVRGRQNRAKAPSED